MSSRRRLAILAISTRRWPARRRGVLEAGVARPEDGLLGVLPDGDDQREAELLPVRGGEIVEVVVLVAVETVESSERLVLHR